MKEVRRPHRPDGCALLMHQEDKQMNTLQSQIGCCPRAFDVRVLCNTTNVGGYCNRVNMLYSYFYKGRVFHIG
ncbi:hypothetical protein KIN20_010730 [Parelaphostrongylus tenuis]|uniref:Uncharacterized protein n=1 Tax=Parelaphostrongylus tenuis TaxID=148309 RepID=A0AAD5MCZ0_PARTN|nr:hypothetical protein KIN20_010722 [Parelaphostrongylus tenuis]KAJ1353950.1 hypothetical protein KIN20_010730 [Parelaphostrongylus tenuis]